MARAFRPRLWPSIATIVMLLLTCGLGAWQMQRLQWKEALLATINQRIHEDPVDIASFRDAEEGNYHPVTVHGVFQNNQAFYLLALSQAGEGGYHVLTPFRLDDGMLLLVDRGWVPYSRRDSFSKIEGRVFLSGILRMPEFPYFSSANDAVQDNWYNVDVTAMGRVAGDVFLPYYVEAETMPTPEFFPVGGQTRVDLPNNHFGYAITWFGLAFILAVIYLLSSFVKADSD